MTLRTIRPILATALLAATALSPAYAKKPVCIEGEKLDRIDNALGLEKGQREQRAADLIRGRAN